MIEYLRSVLKCEEGYLAILERRKVMYLELRVDIAYRIGRVQAMRELIDLLSSDGK